MARRAAKLTGDHASDLTHRHGRLRARRSEHVLVTSEQTPAQVLRTPEYIEVTMVADAGMAGRVFRGLFTWSRLLIFGGMLTLLVVWSVRAAHSISGLPFGSPPVLATVLLIGFAVIGYRLLYRRIARVFPAGTHLSARYLGDRIDVVYGAMVSSVSLAAVTRVRRTRAALNLYRGRTPLLTIPLELVPDDLESVPGDTAFGRAISHSRSS